VCDVTLKPCDESLPMLHQNPPPPPSKDEAAHQDVDVNHMVEQKRQGTTTLALTKTLTMSLSTQAHSETRANTQTTPDRIIHPSSTSRQFGEVSEQNALNGDQTTRTTRHDHDVKDGHPSSLLEPQRTRHFQRRIQTPKPSANSRTRRR
jgi:hypothetical protein